MTAPATEERDRVVATDREEDPVKAPTRRRATSANGGRSGRGATAPAGRSGSPGTQPRLVKASFNLPAEELDALRELAERRQTSATQVLREALRTELYIQGLIDSGAKFVVKTGRRTRELVFSHMSFSA